MSGDSEVQNSAVHKGTCYCGAVKVTVQGPAVASGYCHCLECRKWHSAPINAYSVWASANVIIDGPTTTSNVSRKSGRVSCSTCGGCVANLKLNSSMTVVYPMTLYGEEETFRFEPTAHIYYAERVMDINDGLPKFSNTPKAFGGSGETVDESTHSGWH